MQAKSGIDDEAMQKAAAAARHAKGKNVAGFRRCAEADSAIQRMAKAAASKPWRACADGEKTIEQKKPKHDTRGNRSANGSETMVRGTREPRDKEVRGTARMP